MAIEAHEELIQHIESSQEKIRLLSIITMGVAFLLIASYFSQLLLPLVSSANRYQTVDLLSPILVATEIVLTALFAAWLYVGVVNYLFATRLNKQIREIRAFERELEKKITGQ